jgi:PAS domain S-box-containing protein
MNANEKRHTRDLAQRLAESKGTIEALLSGQIDAVVDSESQTPVLLEKAQRALLESEVRYRALVEWSPESIVVSQRGKILFVNPAAIKMMGATSDHDLIGASLLDMVHPDFRRIARERINNVEHAGILPMNEERFIKLDGTVIDLEVQSISISYNGEAATFSSMHNVTESKRAAEALRESNEKFHMLAEAIPQIVWIARPDGWSVYFNQQWMEYTGLTFEESRGHGWSKPVHPEDQQRALGAWQHATATIGTYSTECRLRRADGVYRWWLIRAVPLRDAGGTVLKWFGTCTDIQDLKVAELEVSRTNRALEVEIVERKRAEDAAEAANRAKSGFLANMSHEIRTPINVIVGMTDMALDGELPVRSRDYLNTVRRAALGLLAIANDILDSSKIAAGMFTMAAVDVSLRSVMAEVDALLAPQARAKGLALECAVDAAIPEHVRADPNRLKQVLVNLIANAIKFTDTGGVTVAFCVLERSATQVRVRGTVRDTGIGILADRRAAIFESFTQADDSTTRTYGGTGLGLSISRDLIRLMGGRIGVESEVGQGSTFWLEITLAVVGEDEETGRPRSAYA